MQIYPISLSIPSSLRKAYDTVQLRAWRKGIQDYLNDHVKDCPEKIIYYWEIENELGIVFDFVNIGGVGGRSSQQSNDNKER